MPRIAVGDTELFYQDDDFADAWSSHDIVLMQAGLCRNGNFWRPWVPTLAREFRVIRLDSRGCGQSAAPKDGFRYSTEGWVDDTIGFMDAMDIEKVHYIGEAVGGIIGGASAAMHPDRFHSLTIIGSPARIPREFDVSLRYGYENQTEAIHALGMRGWYAERWKHRPEVYAANPAKEEWIANEYGRTGDYAGGEIVRWVVTADLEPLLPQIHVPTFLMCAENSPVQTVEEAKRFASLIPNATQKFYANAAQVYIDIPDQAARDALQFIRGQVSDTHTPPTAPGAQR